MGCAVNQNRLTDEQYLDMVMDGCFHGTLETVATCDPRLGEDVSKFGSVFKDSCYTTFDLNHRIEYSDRNVTTLKLTRGCSSIKLDPNQNGKYDDVKTSINVNVEGTVPSNYTTSRINCKDEDSPGCNDDIPPAPAMLSNASTIAYS